MVARARNRFEYLSKSRIMAALQCPKMLHFKVHHPELEETDAATLAAFDTGNRIGELARETYGTPDSVLLGYAYYQMREAGEETERLLSGGHRAPLFEATLQHEGVLVRVDVLVPEGEDGWRLVEVKASTRVKPEHLQDCAIQAWVCRGQGLNITGIGLAHVDSGFVYQGDGDYTGLLVEEDVTEEVEARLAEVPNWVAFAREAVAGPRPDVPVGRHCNEPYACGFFAQCWPVDAEYPVHGLKGSKEKLAKLVEFGYRDIREVPAGMLRAPGHQRIHAVTVSGEPEVKEPAREFVRALPYPRYYLDFETIGPAVPVWEGTRPYAPLPIQWSLHIEHETGEIEHREFLDVSGEPPMRPLAESMIRALGSQGPILMYTGYEKGVIDKLANAFPDLAEDLHAVIERLVDLHPVMKENYYHPKMLGSWSLKAVLPTIAPDMNYSELEEIQEGTAASAAFLEAIHPETSEQRKEFLRQRMLEYCRFDTEAMVRLVRFLSAAEG
jgi:hypothetical protein